MDDSRQRAQVQSAILETTASISNLRQEIIDLENNAATSTAARPSTAYRLAARPLTTRAESATLGPRELGSLAEFLPGNSAETQPPPPALSPELQLAPVARDRSEELQSALSAGESARAELEASQRETATLKAELRTVKEDAAKNARRPAANSSITSKLDQYAEVTAALSEMGVTLPAPAVKSEVLKTAQHTFRNGAAQSVGEAISIADKRNSGYLEAAELAQVAALLGLLMTAADTEAVMQQIDTDGDGLVSRFEIEHWWGKLMIPHKTVFTATEEREKRETAAVLEAKFKERERALQAQLADAERRIKIELARTAEQEQKIRADCEEQIARSKTTRDPEMMAEARRARHELQLELTAAKTEIDAKNQELAVTAQKVRDSAETTRNLREAEARASTAERALEAERVEAGRAKHQVRADSSRWLDSDDGSFRAPQYGDTQLTVVRHPLFNEQFVQRPDNLTAGWWCGNS